MRHPDLSSRTTVFTHSMGWVMVRLIIISPSPQFVIMPRLCIVLSLPLSVLAEEYTDREIWSCDAPQARAQKSGTSPPHRAPQIVSDRCWHRLHVRVERRIRSRIGTFHTGNRCSALAAPGSFPCPAPDSVLEYSTPERRLDMSHPAHCA